MKGENEGKRDEAISPLPKATNYLLPLTDSFVYT